MRSEKLKSKEQQSAKAEEPASNFTRLDDVMIENVIKGRKDMLEKIRAEVSLKAYYAMEEKIQAEENKLKQILDFKMGRQKQLARYTFILDPRYFEQEFLN